MDDLSSVMPLVSGAAPAASAPADAGAVAARRRTVLPAWFAAIQVALVCGIPTQVLISAVLILGTDLPILNGDKATIDFFAMLSLLDTALVALLIRVFLALSGETSRDVFLGTRPSWRETLRGLALMPILLVVASGLGLGVRYVAPWTHNVAVNPFESYMQSPIEAAIFIVVVVLAGGVREELQRAFILHRFEQRLGGVWIGLAVHSFLFFLLHLIQGVDAAITVGFLGLVWGAIYIRRRSAVMGIVSHAGFDAAQVLLTFFGR